MPNELKGQKNVFAFPPTDRRKLKIIFHFLDLKWHYHDQNGEEYDNDDSLTVTDFDAVTPTTQTSETVTVDGFSRDLQLGT